MENTILNTYWKDLEILVLYHGTSLSNWKSIQKEGLKPGSDGEIYLTPSREQAWGYSIMGGEEQYLKAHKTKKSIKLSNEKRVVIEVTIRPCWLDLNGGGIFKSREEFEKALPLIKEFEITTEDLQLEFHTGITIHPRNLKLS